MSVLGTTTRTVLLLLFLTFNGLNLFVVIDAGLNEFGKTGGLALETGQELEHLGFQIGTKQADLRLFRVVGMRDESGEFREVVVNRGGLFEVRECMVGGCLRECFIFSKAGQKKSLEFFKVEEYLAGTVDLILVPTHSVALKERDNVVDLVRESEHTSHGTEVEFTSEQEDPSV